MGDREEGDRSREANNGVDQKEGSRGDRNSEAQDRGATDNLGRAGTCW